MAMTLQQAIDFATNPPVTAQFGIEVAITVTMHDDAGDVLVGDAFGLSSMFRPDLPLLNLGGTATIAHGGAGATTGRGSLFTRGPAPGFSTRGLGPGDGAGASLGVVRGANSGATIPIDFSVRSDPGIPWLSFLGMGPGVQIEIEKLSAPAPGGTATSGILLQAAEDGALLRAVGPSLQDAARRASYTATILVWERIG
jgi:hypothetical protein